MGIFGNIYDSIKARRTTLSDDKNMAMPVSFMNRVKKYVARTLMFLGGSFLLAILLGAMFGKSSTTSASGSAPQASGSVATTAPLQTTTTAPLQTTTTAPPQTTTTQQVSDIGQTVRDGDFAFVVTALSCGASAASAVSGGGYGETIPAGAQECIVTMTITNDKNVAQSFFESNQYAYDASNRQFSADSTGSLFLQNSQVLTTINPGISVTAEVPFQIPANDTITRLVLHDSAFSGGVTAYL